MTNDYIDRKAAIEKANKFAYIYHANRHEETAEAFLMFVQELKFLPAADVKPIVRCENCIWRFRPMKSYCNVWGRFTNDTDYCSYGELRGNDNE